MSTRLGILLVLGGVLTLVLAACGGGESTATPQPTRTPQPTATSVPGATAAPLPTATSASPATATATAAPTATQAPRPTATSVAAVGAPKYGGILQARLTRDWDNWDIYHAAGGFTSVFNQQLLSNLLRFKKDSISVMEADLAQSWEVSAEGKSYTFRLRQDANWSDGKPVTSADVAYNLGRAADPKYTFNKEKVALIATIETPDPSTIKLTLKRVSASFLPNIAGAFMLMYPSHVTDMAQWQKAPVGSGPFVFEKYNKGVSYLFRKNTSYYGKDAAGRTLPYMDGIDYTVIVDPALALAAFRAGRSQCGCGFDSDFLTEAKEQLEKDIPGVKLGLTFPSRHEMRFNLRKAPFNNLAFRQGVAIGLDKEKIASVYRRGLNYRPAPPLVAPERGGQWGLPKGELTKIPGYNPDHAADVALAQQKFRESGIDPKTVQVEIIFSSFFGAEGELMATVLSELGIKATPVPLGTTEMAQRRIGGRFEIDHVTAGISLDDPGDQYTPELLSDGSFNFGKYVNDRVDQLLRDQDAELDPAKRRSILWDIQRINLTEFPMVPFLYQGNGYGTRPEVFNFRTPPLAVHAAFRLEEVWIA